MKIIRYIFATFFLYFLQCEIVEAKDEKLNIYCWAEEIPYGVIKDFSEEYGIDVSLTNFDNNETMYSKVKLLDKNSDYDIICPSSYYITKMKNEGLIKEIDKTKISNLKNIDISVLNKDFDPDNKYSLPYVMTQTGILYNSKYISDKIDSWGALFNEKYKGKILLLDDIREVFAIGLILLGYSGNDTNTHHLEQAYIKLKELMLNVKIFSAESLKIPFITEEVIIGMNWNAESYVSIQENSDLRFIYPKEGTILALDNFTIAKYSKNAENAYKFIDYVYRAEVAKKIIEEIGYNIPNHAAKKLLPKEIRDDEVIFPSDEVLKNGIFQQDLGKSIGTYEKLWSKLKANN